MIPPCRFLTFLTLLWLALPLAAQSDSDTPLAAVPVEAEARDNTYILRPNDMIRLEVFQEPELTTSVRILKTGQASFPLIGAIEVSGISVEAARRKISDLYAKDYLVNPSVTLTVTDYATEFISIIGAVRSPGQIPIPVSGNLDLAAAMAICGGLADTADPSGILLVRATGESSTYTQAQIQGASARVKLLAGDRIIVNQSRYVGKSITMLGQVGRQGPMAFPVSGKLDLVQAIAMAGGLTQLANPKKVTINRNGKTQVVDYKEISQRANDPFLLQPGDIVIVAERLF